MRRPRVLLADGHVLVLEALQKLLEGRAYPASHGCVRLLERDAKWLYRWGESWQLAAGGREIQEYGTPVLIVGQYQFRAPPPWRSLEWLARGIQLPSWPGRSACD